MDTMLVFIGLFIGCSFGFLIAAMLVSNKANEQWHNGYRAGKYSGNDTN